MLRIEQLTRRFDDVLAVDAVSLDVQAGEFLTLLGPSGCGKTTTLRLIAGFERPTAGRIFLDGRDVTRLPPQQRAVGMVFQNYALFPHLDVFENIAFGLKARRLGRAQIAARVEQSLERVDLAGYSRRRVQELSGGQQQRVALARALAPEPPVLLLDEPLSNLDAALRERTRAELRLLLKRLDITAVFVTHDQEEAFALSDRIALLESGRLQQIDTPEALYRDPTNSFVASFLGRANFMAGRIMEDAGDSVICEVGAGARWRVRIPAPNGDGSNRSTEDPSASSLSAADTSVSSHGMAGASVPNGTTADSSGPTRSAPDPGTPNPRTAERNMGVGTMADGSGAVRIMVRPEALRVLPSSAGVRGPADLEGTVLERRFAGAVTHYRIRIGDAELFAHGTPADARPGDAVLVRPLEGALPLAFNASDERAERAIAR